jgi:nicotinic acid mononucleotide adenylyltransferase
LYRAIPANLLAPGEKAVRSRKPRSIRLRHTTIHILDTVASHVSATGVRRRAEHGQSVHGLVPPAVEDYITKVALYR